MDESNPDWAPTLHLGHSDVRATESDRYSIQLNSKALLSIPTEGRKLSLDKGSTNSTIKKTITQFKIHLLPISYLKYHWQQLE